MATALAQLGQFLLVQQEETQKQPAGNCDMNPGRVNFPEQRMVEINRVMTSDAQIFKPQESKP